MMSRYAHVAFVTLLLPISTMASSNVLFVLDASGSMWAKVDGREKVAIARETLSSVVAKLPTDTPMGLEVYGHHRKGDCTDIELLVPVASSNASTVRAALRTIVPRGMTPITGALEHAAEQLRTLEGATTVILVSDGQETCSGDPCAAVQRLRDLDIRFTAHVIGFDVGAEARAQLECIAREGGGLYFSAKDAPALADALTRITNEVVDSASEEPTTSSDFDGNAEGWTVAGDGNLSGKGDPTLDQGAIRATDQGKGGVWYWVAPAAFLGDQSSLYRGTLSYRLKTSGVDGKEWPNGDVVLEGGGLQLQHNGPRPSTEWTTFHVALQEEAWTHVATGQLATHDDVLRTLSSLTALRIRGEYRTGPDTGWLDDVRMRK